MKQYRIREEQRQSGNLFIPEIKNGWWAGWKQWYQMRGGDDPCPPQINFSSLEEAKSYLRKKWEESNPTNRIHGFEGG